MKTESIHLSRLQLGLLELLFRVGEPMRISELRNLLNTFQESKRYFVIWRSLQRLKKNKLVHHDNERQTYETTPKGISKFLEERW